MVHDALGAHARDELGISAAFTARPMQAAMASAGSFVAGAVLPLAVAAIAPRADLIPLVSGTSLLFLAILGGLAARVGGAGVTLGAMRVTFWGALAMAVTAGVGGIFGTPQPGLEDREEGPLTAHPRVLTDTFRRLPR